MGLVAETADEVAVMYMGRIVERAPVERISIIPVTLIPRLSFGQYQFWAMGKPRG